MNLPAPKERLANCVWLPRILAKARMLLAGKLPVTYAERFCHPTGVDTIFLNHFKLEQDDILQAAAKPDAAAVSWFCARAEGSTANIARWNEVAINLGRPGYPLAERFHIAKETTYQHVDSKGMTTVFELLEADDQLS